MGTECQLLPAASPVSNSLMQLHGPDPSRAPLVSVEASLPPLLISAAGISGVHQEGLHVCLHPRHTALDLKLLLQTSSFLKICIFCTNRKLLKNKHTSSNPALGSSSAWGTGAYVLLGSSRQNSIRHPPVKSQERIFHEQ